MRAPVELGGTVRACRPEETLARVTPLFGRLGITRVADVTGLDTLGVPVALCIRPSARNLSVSQGKGLTPELARASAVMESIELWHAEHLPPPVLVAPFASLGNRALDPGALRPGYCFGRWRPELPTAWAAGRDLVSGADVLVPRAALDLDTTASGPEAGLLGASSNGLASGNTRAEATLHALCELVERDCSARFAPQSSADREARRLCLHDLAPSPLRSALDGLRREVEAEVWDIAGPVGIPAFACTLTERGAWRALGCFVGHGCHPRPTVALARAVTEAAQARLTAITGSRDDVFPSFYRSPDRRRLPPQTPAPGPLPPPAEDPGAAAWSIEGHLEDVVDRLRQGGYRKVAVVDHTRPDLEVPVVHAIVPGLRFRAVA
ncbi:MAG: YcaO-like family protein [Acidimicrobiales bacterium]